MIPKEQVNNLRFKLTAEGELDPVELGRELKADYVLHLEIEQFQIYEPKSYRRLFHGKADIAISLYKMKTKDVEDGHLVFGPKDYMPEYPSSGPESAEGVNPNYFRRMFVQKAGQEISRMFIAYPPEEKHANID